MIYVRYEKKGEARYGWLDGQRLGAVTGDVWGSFKRESIVAELPEVKILPPVTPSKIIGVSQNYESRLNEQGLARPDIPPLFLKPASAVVGPGEPIALPPQSQQVEHEAELAVII